MKNYLEHEDEIVSEVFKYADQSILFKLQHGIDLGYIDKKLQIALEKAGHIFPKKNNWPSPLF